MASTNGEAHGEAAATVNDDATALAAAVADWNTFVFGAPDLQLPIEFVVQINPNLHQINAGIPPTDHGADKADEKNQPKGDGARGGANIDGNEGATLQTQEADNHDDGPQELDWGDVREIPLIHQYTGADELSTRFMATPPPKTRKNTCQEGLTRYWMRFGGGSTK